MVVAVRWLVYWCSARLVPRRPPKFISAQLSVEPDNVMQLFTQQLELCGPYIAMITMIWCLFRFLPPNVWYSAINCDTCRTVTISYQSQNTHGWYCVWHACITTVRYEIPIRIILSIVLLFLSAFFVVVVVLVIVDYLFPFVHPMCKCYPAAYSVCVCDD